MKNSKKNKKSLEFHIPVQIYVYVKDQHIRIFMFSKMRHRFFPKYVL
jgi:hypothetical protein